MKVLTIREPWVCFIRQGIKTTETRSRKTNYRGELYIHTGLKTDIVPTELRKQYDPAESFPGTICPDLDRCAGSTSDNRPGEIGLMELQY